MIKNNTFRAKIYNKCHPVGLKQHLCRRRNYWLSGNEKILPRNLHFFCPDGTKKVAEAGI
jgi:hypothetical protein